MSESVTFLWVELENFRGFRDKQRIDLDASAVILLGPNGSGKTSLFDALQWLLLGSVERLEPWRARRNTEHIVNQFRQHEPATVSSLSQIGDRLVRLHRQGRGSHHSSLLEWQEKGVVLRAEEAETELARALTPDNAQSLQQALMSSGLLNKMSFATS